MKKLNQVSLLLIASLIMSSSCKKDNQPPADPFTSLSNQLVCKIDGKEWKSNDVTGGVFYIPSPDRKYLYLAYKKGDQRIYIFINPPFNQTIYNLNKNTIDFPSNSYPENYMALVNYYSDLTPEDRYVTNDNETGQIEFLTFDTLGYKFKATFSFIGKDNQTGKKISVTEGYLEYHQ